MQEDKLLVRKLKHGDSEALHRIYEKYKNELLALSVALSGDRTLAEDVVHDVFVSFAEFAGRLQLRGSLKSYLSSCVANRVRSLARAEQAHSALLDEARVAGADSNEPAYLAMSAEQLQRINQAVAQLPYRQREVIILHLQAGMKFRQIAEQQDLSVNTVQARYRYGLDKLRETLNGETRK